MKFNFSFLGKNKKAFIFSSLSLILIFGYFYSAKPSKLSALNGVSLGMDMNEVEYILGEPNLAWEEVPLDIKIKVKDGTELSTFVLMVDADKVKKSPNQFYDFFYWNYEKISGNLMINFSDKKVVKSIGCSSLDDKSVCDIYGIKLNDSEELVVSKLGSPTSSSIKNGYKFMKYKDLNLTVNFKEKKLVSLAIEEIE